MWSGLFLAPGSVGQWLGTPLFGFIIGVLSLAVERRLGLFLGIMYPGWFRGGLDRVVTQWLSCNIG